MPTSKAFEAAYRALNKRQREAVDTIHGPVMIIAGPGTGKTQVLTVRIANILLKTDTPPEAVLALTFTEKAAHEMRTRLVELIGQTAYRVHISTFHAFANEIIHAEPDKFPRLIGGTNITEPDQLALIERILAHRSTTILRPLGRPEAYVKAILGAIGTLKGAAITQAQLKKLSETDKQRELLAVWQTYEDALTNSNQYDFADMLVEVCSALKTNKLLKAALREQYLFFLIDEHQDTNRSQNQIVQYIAEADASPNIFVVGDLEQAIYRFQGASPENFRDFTHRYPTARVIRLEENYRSSQLLLDAAQHISSGQGKLVARAARKNAPVRTYEFSSPIVQEWSIARMVQERIKQGTPPERIAVLYRTNAEAAGIVEACAHLKILCAVRGDDDVLGDRSIQKLLAVIRAAVCMPEPGPLLIALHLDLLRCSPLDAHKIATVRDQNPWDVIRSPARLRKLDCENSRAIANAYATLRELAQTTANTSAAYALQEAVRLTGFIPAVTVLPDGDQILSKLHALFDLVRAQTESNHTLTLATFLETLDRLALHHTDIKAELNGRESAVQLMTAHRAKGLEFDAVYIINAVHGHWDGARKPVQIELPIVKDDDPDDVRRLFYVALTRARHEAIITWPRQKMDGKGLLPSGYVLAIPESLRTQGNAEPYEQAFLKHRDIRFSAPKQTTPLKEKKYLVALFQERGLTVTALNNYLECPWRYFFSNLVRIPEAPSLAGELGTAMHKSLKVFFNRLSHGERIGAPYLISQLETALDHAPLARRDIKRLLGEGRETLAGWHGFWKEKGGWSTNVHTEVTIDGITLDDGTKLSGKLDKIELSNNSVQVVDYKTKAPMSRNAIMGQTKSSTGNEWRQLVFYKLLLDRWQKGVLRMTDGAIDFLEPTPAGIYKKEVFEVTPAHVAELIKTIQQVSKDIRTLAFWSKRCEDRDCKYCHLRNLME